MTNPAASERKARPFVKWAGGKRHLASTIWDLAPSNFGNYFEPFVGGGSVFFAMPDHRGLSYLSDVNTELITTYCVIRDNVDELIEKLKAHTSGHQSNPDYFYQVRAQVPSDPLCISARFIYLNKTCFNGLYRVNSAGEFNVPKGSYANPTICDADGLRQACLALANTEIQVETFEALSPEPGDFVYCDPPYDGTFTGYVPGGFGQKAQERLSETAAIWGSSGIKVMISNADTPLIRELYPSPTFRIRKVQAPRFINSDGEGRGRVDELLVTTYD